MPCNPRDDGDDPARISYEGWREVTASILDAAFLCVRASLPHLARGGRGAIVNIGGVAGHAGVGGRAHVVAETLQNTADGHEEQWIIANRSEPADGSATAFPSGMMTRQTACPQPAARCEALHSHVERPEIR